MHSFNLLACLPFFFWLSSCEKNVGRELKRNPPSIAPYSSSKSFCFSSPRYHSCMNHCWTALKSLCLSRLTPRSSTISFTADSFAFILECPQPVACQSPLFLCQGAVFLPYFTCKPGRRPGRTKGSFAELQQSDFPFWVPKIVKQEAMHQPFH